MGREMKKFREKIIKKLPYGARMQELKFIMINTGDIRELGKIPKAEVNGYQYSDRSETESVSKQSSLI